MHQRNDPSRIGEYNPILLVEMTCTFGNLLVDKRACAAFAAI